MIDHYWILFDIDENIECFCRDNKKCLPELKPKCKEYIVKFIEVDRTVNNAIKDIDLSVNTIQRKIKTELEKSLKIIKGFKL